VKPRLLTEELASGAALLVTMGCGEACPFVPGLRRMDWPLEDPKGKPVERVRAIREEVRALVAALVAAEGYCKD
jgi:arsenate reductase